MKTAMLILLLLALTIGFCSADISIEDTCKSLVQTRAPELYDFCVKTLNSDPSLKSSADKEALEPAVSSMASQCVEKTMDKIQNLTANPDQLTEDQKMSMDLCRTSYMISRHKLEGVPLHGKIGFRSGGTYVSAAMDRIQSCIDIFDKVGIISMLPEENDQCMNLIHLLNCFVEDARRR